MSNLFARREFLKRASLLSVAGTATPFALNLAAIGAASAQSGGDYRALVCLYMDGGNDQVNTLTPYDTTSYNEYASIRPDVAHARASLSATNLGAVASQGGREFALHPALTGMKALWDQQKLAVVANVGPLMVPTTRSQYENRAVPLPPRLFSHNDQSTVWQAYKPLAEGAAQGWGGRMGDLLASMNASSNFTCVSAKGDALMLSGGSTRQYRIGPNGPVAIAGVTTEMYNNSNSRLGYRSLLTGTNTHLLRSELAAVHRRSMASTEQLASVYPAASVFSTPVPAENDLAKQLHSIARMIYARSSLGMHRQVFFVKIGTFDHHNGLVDRQEELLSEMDAAVSAFWQWIGQMNLQQQVTLFTASEFGRTLASNGDGTDHGWGGHHFVLGGAVRGKNIYGTCPPMALVHPQAAGARGALIPTIAVDQYAATLARWMGVSDANVPVILPNVVNFGTSRYLPFLA